MKVRSLLPSQPRLSGMQTTDYSKFNKRFGNSTLNHLHVIQKIKKNCPRTLLRCFCFHVFVPPFFFSANRRFFAVQSLVGHSGPSAMAPHVANAGYPVHLEAIQVSPGQTHIDSLPMRKPYLDVHGSDRK